MNTKSENKYQTKLDRAIERSERHTQALKNKVPNALGKFANSYCRSNWKLSKNGRVKVNWISASKNAPQPKQPQLSNDDKDYFNLGRFIASRCRVDTKQDPNNPSRMIQICINYKGHQFFIQ